MKMTVALRYRLREPFCGTEIVLGWSGYSDSQPDS